MRPIRRPQLRRSSLPAPRAGPRYLAGGARSAPDRQQREASEGSAWSVDDMAAQSEEGEAGQFDAPGRRVGGAGRAVGGRRSRGGPGHRDGAADSEAPGNEAQCRRRCENRSPDMDLDDNLARRHGATRQTSPRHSLGPRKYVIPRPSFISRSRPKMSEFRNMMESRRHVFLRLRRRRPNHVS